ncbi:MAG: DUF2066 domain-containing protein [Gammaproteobacteria bacterium]|nr:DUF2066 domain-containing protein [Gammaproteobacteria bacterium]
MKIPLQSRYLLGYVSLSLLLMAAMPAAALQVTGLYSHRVAVANETDSERELAFRQALMAVILKVTGERRWLDHPKVQQALNDAQNYVEAIAYSSEMIKLPESGTVAQSNNEAATSMIQQRFIEVDFAARLIDQLLADANIPVWDSNRPSVLLWVALQDAEGNRTLLSTDGNADIISIIQSYAKERGLPVIFPVLDFEDRRNLPEDLVWSLNEIAIRRASERYNADSVLAGRLHFTASGELVGLWQFQFGGNSEVFDGFDTGIEGYLKVPLERITARLASYFAIVPKALVTDTVSLKVEGVSNLEDYSAVLSYLGNLGLVESVLPAVLDGEQLELKLDLVGNTDQLHELIALDRDLLPIQSSQIGNGAVLHYRWTR